MPSESITRTIVRGWHAVRIAPHQQAVSTYKLTLSSIPVNTTATAASAERGALAEAHSTLEGLATLAVV